MEFSLKAGVGFGDSILAQSVMWFWIEIIFLILGKNNVFSHVGGVGGIHLNSVDQICIDRNAMFMEIKELFQKCKWKSKKRIFFYSKLLIRCYYHFVMGVEGSMKPYF